MKPWDDLAAERAEFHNPDPDRDTGLTYPLGALRESRRLAFRHGASWQRRQLLADETVEAAAADLYESECAGGRAGAWAGLLADGDAPSATVRFEYLGRARAVLTAALNPPETAESGDRTDNTPNYPSRTPNGPGRRQDVAPGQHSEGTDE